MRIWFALLAAPLLALADQSVSFATVGWACAHQLPIAVHAVHVLFLGAITAGTIPAWQLWRRTLSTRTRTEKVARRHFLAGLAAASGFLSMLVIIAMWLPAWMIAPCSN
jgi:hypothetical protein